MTHHPTRKLLARLRRAQASRSEAPKGRKSEHIALGGRHLLLMVKNNRLPGPDKADRCTGTTLGRARTVFAAHPVSCFRDVDERARSGHPPIIFRMKESRRAGRRDEDEGGGGNERLKNKRKFTSCSGPTSGSRWKRTRTVNDGLRAWTDNFSFRHTSFISWPLDQLLLWLITLSFPGGFQSYFNNFVTKKTEFRPLRTYTCTYLQYVPWLTYLCM